MYFEHAVSLGAWCQVSYQLRRHFQHTTASCFDWLVTPWSGLLGILNDGTKELGQSIIDNRWAKSAECTKYGILLPHEFPHNSKHEVVFSFKASQQALEKLNHKHEKMLRTLRNATGPVLFVRYGGHALPAAAWPYLADTTPFDLQSLNELCGLLTTLFPSLRFMLLFVYETATTTLTNRYTALDRRIHISPVERNNDYSRWQGGDALWDGMLEETKRRGPEVFGYAPQRVVNFAPKGIPAE